MDVKQLKSISSTHLHLLATSYVHKWHVTRAASIYTLWWASGSLSGRCTQYTLTKIVALMKHTTDNAQQTASEAQLRYSALEPTGLTLVCWETGCSCCMQQFNWTERLSLVPQIQMCTNFLTSLSCVAQTPARATALPNNIHRVGPNSIYTQYICPILCWNLQINGVYIRFWPTLNIHTVW